MRDARRSILFVLIHCQEMRNLWEREMFHNREWRKNCQTSSFSLSTPIISNLHIQPWMSFSQLSLSQESKTAGERSWRLCNEFMSINFSGGSRKKCSSLIIAVAWKNTLNFDTHKVIKRVEDIIWGEKKMNSDTYALTFILNFFIYYSSPASECFSRNFIVCGAPRTRDGMKNAFTTFSRRRMLIFHQFSLLIAAHSLVRDTKMDFIVHYYNYFINLNSLTCTQHIR